MCIRDRSSRLRAYRLDELLHPDDRSAVFQAIGRAMAVGEEVAVSYTHLDVYKRQGRCRVQAAGASVCHMGDDGCQLQAVHKGGGGGTAALDPKAHHAASM